VFLDLWPSENHNNKVMGGSERGGMKRKNNRDMRDAPNVSDGTFGGAKGSSKETSLTDRSGFRTAALGKGAKV